MDNVEEVKKYLMECGYYEEGKYTVEISKKKLQELYEAEDIILV